MRHIVKLVATKENRTFTRSTLSFQEDAYVKELRYLKRMKRNHRWARKAFRELQWPCK